jgi:galactosylceramidase
VLDYLFKPQFGASLQILKVEIGGSCDSTNGAEAPHRYTAAENADFTRGYEWWLLTEAKKRNPLIKTYGLPWCWPAFIGNGTGNPFFDGGETAAAYIVEWAKAARDVYDVGIDYVGLWNEKSSPDSYIMHLRSALDDAGLSSTSIVAADQGGWWSSGNATVDEAVFALGCHYPGSTSSAAAKASGKPLFASEDNSRSCLPGQNGGACWARAIVENAANGQMSGSISWSLINSWYAGIQFYGDGLMSAVEPWSGNYYVGTPIWSSAHTTQFTAPGWHYTRPGAGLGYLTYGGTYATLGSGAGDWTIVIEKLDRSGSQCSWSGVPPNVTTPENATFVLGGSLAALKELHAWHSTFSANGDADPSLVFAYEGSLPVAADGTITLPVAVGDVWTLSTVATATKGGYGPPPNASNYPLVTITTCAGVALGQEPPYLSDMNGNFQCVDGSPYGRPAGVLRSMTPARPIVWLRSDTTPHAIIGDPDWTSVNASVDVYIPAANGSAALGIHCHGLDVDDTACLWLLLTAGAAATGKNGSWGVYASAGQLSNASLATDGGELTIAPGVWHTAKVSAAGGSSSTASLTVDGVIVAGAVPLGGATSGFVGVGTANYGDFTLFDNLKIAAATPPSPSPPPPPPSCPKRRSGAPSSTPQKGAPGACLPPVPGDIVTTLACGSGGAEAWAWTPSPSHPGLGSLALGGLCVAANATARNPQTGAPSVQLQVCTAAADQLWSALPTAGVSGSIKTPAGDCMEVTKNEAGAGVLLETWSCNGGTNQAWCLAHDGSLSSLLDGFCAGVCVPSVSAGK